MACLWPHPPENAYLDLRPWDGRDVPTMELFPMVGDGCLVCLIVNYLGVAYRTNLVMKIPRESSPVSLADLDTGQDLLASAHVDGRRVSLPIDMEVDKEFLVVELQWE